MTDWTSTLKRYVVIAIVGLVGGAQASTYDLTPRLIRKAEMRQLYSVAIRPFAVDRNVQLGLERWLTHPATQSFLVGDVTPGGTDLPGCLDLAQTYMRSATLIGPFCYLLRMAAFSPSLQVREDAAERLGLLVMAWLKGQELVLEEIAEDPKFQESGAASRAKNLLSQLQDWMKGESHGLPNVMAARDCVGQVWPRILKTKTNGIMTLFSPEWNCYRGMGEGSGLLEHSGNRALAKMTGLAAADFSREFLSHPGHVISATGWIPGNKVTYLTRQKMDFETRDRLQDSYDKIQWEKTYSLSVGGAGTVEGMQARIQARGWRDVFTEPGFYDLKGHPVLEGAPDDTQIFHEIVSALGQAKKNIFIDVFFLGGTLGAALAKHVVAQLEDPSKRDLKVVVLRDEINHFGYKAQMDPVTNFLRAYALLNPGRLVVAPAHIKSHVPGLPQFIADAMSDSLLMFSGLQRHLSLYGRAMSDHSKVIGIDTFPGSSEAKVFVGSKNLLDSSGAWAFDEVAMVEGPVALTVVDNYFEDMVAALYYHFSGRELEAHLKGIPLRFENRGSVTVPTLKRNSGEAKAALQKLQKIVTLLDRMGFDFLGRIPVVGLESIAFEVPNPRKVLVPDKGSVPIRIGENNFDSSIVSCADQVIHNVLLAKSKIRISDQYFFDENITKAIKRAQERARGAVDFKAIVESYSKSPELIEEYFNIPNQIYVDEIVNDAGGRIKWKKNYSSRNIHQEYHMKTTSVDGRVLITGSANKDRNTMYGAFRETQLEIFDPSSGGAPDLHDRQFEIYWSDSRHTSGELKPYHFRVPPQFDGKLTPEDFIKVTKMLLRVLYSTETRALD